jgi:hypothetical protein
MGHFTETGRKIGSGGMRLGKNVKKTYKLRDIQDGYTEDIYSFRIIPPRTAYQEFAHLFAIS